MLPKAVLHHLFLAISLAITSLWATNPGNNVAFSSKFLEAQTLVFGFGEVVAARVVGAMSALAIKDIQHDVLQFVYDSAGMGSGEAGEEFDGGEFEGREFYGGDRQIPAYEYEFEDDGSAFPIDDPAVRFDEGDSEDFTRGEIIFVFSALIGLCAIFRSIIRWLARCFTTAADAPEDPDPDPSEPPDGSIEAARGRMSHDVIVFFDDLAPPASAPVDASAATALVSDGAIPTASAIEVHPATPANVAIPAVVAPSEYLSADEFLAAHKAAHWNITANKKFSAKSGANLKALERLAGVKRPFFFPFMANIDGIATSVRTQVPHYVGPDGILYAVGINGNPWIHHTGPPDGCAILPRPPKPASP
ncbi:hypothetical protein FIBSPDRAFT_927981 [Athelia psychrophila]|uniref:Uncharacterized protein n=1 Tax=Athelia psychrophila TaxID=1759441 RepID=A0A166QYC2_9AGAM|nr:hypothetical protein FIBSPDRAFT_927981 [Fibularhizoctonia sp. CBS 109695]